MNKLILKPGVQEFINLNLNTDILSVLLKKSVFRGISSRELAQQIEAKNKCVIKLPLWFTTPLIYYPDKLNIEQASSEITAAYKAVLVQGQSLLDLTGGVGVDSYFFGKHVDQITLCESNTELAEITAHNYKILGANNLVIHASDGIAFLETCGRRFDWIYLDPSRRNEANQKVYMLEACVPDVTAHLDLLFKHADNILIKSSPLLDLTMGLKELRHVREIHVVAVNNEVKELLWVINGNFSGEVCVHTIDLNKSRNDAFHFSPAEEKGAVSTFALPSASHYLYEPNAALLKSGAFKLIGQRFSLHKLQEHSHLFTSDKLIPFPGRVLRVRGVVPFNRRAMARFQHTKANVTTRNFPENVAVIRKKYKIADGGTAYLFFTKGPDEQLIVICCEKVTET